MNLTLLILVPLITAVAVLLMRNKQQVKWIALAGATVQLALALVLLFTYRNEVASGDNAQFLFQQQYEWFPSWHISFHLGVDGLSVTMVLLTAFVVIAGVLVSWNIEKMTKEFYFLLILLSIGAYGLFLFIVCGFWCIHCIIPFSYMGTRWAFICSYSGFYVFGRYIYEVGWLWLFARSHLPYAGRS